MKEKKCPKCKDVKPVEYFYTDKSKSNGLMSHCKECCCKEKREYRKNNRELLLKRSREKYQRYKEKYSLSDKLRAKNNPLKFKARSIVSSAIKSGLLKEECCDECGCAETEAHHEDYTKPLEVVWLCRKHHAKRHRKYK